MVDFLWRAQCKPGENLLGIDSADTDTLRRFSPNLNVTADTPPAFIWHTASDEIVPVRHCTRLADALSEKNVPFELHIFPEGRHGLSLAKGIPDVGQWTRLCQEWLIRLGFAQ